jgi:hypothetical protein
MKQEDQELLDLLKFELKFLEDGGYGRSPHTPWLPQLAFEDSPTCPNFRDSARPHPCSECLLMRFVPRELQNQQSPCRLIPLTDKGETIDYFYRYGTQMELEEFLAGWLRKQIREIEQHGVTPGVALSSKTMDRLRRRQWLAFAGNLYTLANRQCENHNYLAAHALYGRALAATQKVATLGDSGRSLVARTRQNQQAVSEILYGGEKGSEQAPSEELQTVEQ